MSVKVSVSQKQRPVEYDPEIKVKFTEEEGCLSSQLVWSSESVQAALVVMFGRKTDEELTHLTIDQHGIRAYFRTKR